MDIQEEINHNINILNNYKKYSILKYIYDNYNIDIDYEDGNCKEYIIYSNKNIITIILKDNRQFDIPLSLFSILKY